jgi:hypothetical protein
VFWILFQYFSSCFIRIASLCLLRSF